MKNNIKIPEDLKAYFQDDKEILEFKERCIKILSEQPDFHKIRVFLSKLYFMDGYFDFAIRELEYVKNSGDYPIIDRILKSLGTSSNKNQSTSTVAEIKL